MSGDDRCGGYVAGVSEHPVRGELRVTRNGGTELSDGRGPRLGDGFAGVEWLASNREIQPHEFGNLVVQHPMSLAWAVTGRPHILPTLTSRRWHSGGAQMLNSRGISRVRYGEPHWAADTCALVGAGLFDCSGSCTCGRKMQCNINALCRFEMRPNWGHPGFLASFAVA
jgi:hypothetical protein